ncbi:protein serine/threonine phosphatase 2C [Panus rudis PR-1116 ss-1]|nr:protein serine/threonine phosphatase 2C [Panus rudis PR-1116 ss-1]
MNTLRTPGNSFKRTVQKSCSQQRNHRLRELSTSALPRPFRFHVGASWAGKQPDPIKKKIKTASFPSTSAIGAWRDHVLSRPKANKRKDIGEDFFYIQDMRNQSGLSMGVADGVGGWIDSGVDPALFAQALMHHAHRYAKTSWPGEPEIDPTQDYEEREQVEGWELRPQECLELAYGGVLRERAVLAGSSTGCIVHLNAGNGILRSANLGDSGFCIIRSSSLLYQQEPQTHFFNCPKQLSKIPPILGGRGTLSDSPRDADVYETKVLDGDIVILYTDGLSDNVFHSEMVSVCSLVSRQFATVPRLLDPSQVVSSFQEDALVQAIADRMVDYAQMCMINKRRISPFQRAAIREGLYHRGGKVDE